MIPYQKTIWASTFSLFLAAGCSSDNGSGAASPPVAGVLRGQVHGGQAPVAGSAIALYAVGSGGAATRIETTTTDVNGNFSLASTCSTPGLTPTTLIYVTSSGGNPGQKGEGVNNSAIGMMAALGQCQNASFANIDEVTTVAAAYALSGFTIDNSTVNLVGKGSASGVSVAASISNGAGIANAFNTAALLADPTTGAVQTTLQVAAATQINTLANSLAACVNTGSSTSAQCTELFDCATPGAVFNGSSSPADAGSSSGSITLSSGDCTTTATPATDVLGAALSVVHNAGTVSITGVYDAATRNVVFSPALGAAPNDWTLQLAFTGGLDFASSIAIDAAGDVLVDDLNGNQVLELPAGATTLTAFSSVIRPMDIAIDPSGDVWVTSQSGGSTEPVHPGVVTSGRSRPMALKPPDYPGETYAFDSTGAALTGSPYSVAYNVGLASDSSGDMWVTGYGFVDELTHGSSGIVLALSAPLPQTDTIEFGLAIDASGDVWVAVGTAKTPGSLVRLDSSGNVLGGSPYAPGESPYGLAIDASGQVWISYLNPASVGKQPSVGKFVPGTGTSPPSTSTLAPAIEPSAGTFSSYSGGGISGNSGAAIDANGNVWMPNDYGVSELSNSGAPLSPSTGFYAPAGYYTNYYGYAVHPIAVDASGDVWVGASAYEKLATVVAAGGRSRYARRASRNAAVHPHSRVDGTGALIEIIGAAAPTRTPLVETITPGAGFTP